MNKTILIALGVVVLIGLGGFFLMNSASKPSVDTSSEGNTTTSSTQTSSINSGSTTTQSTQAGVKEFTIEGDNYDFETKQITVNKGDTVKIIFKNTGGIHDWVIDEFNARTKQIKSGETDTVTFIADESGTFEYYCSVGNHRQMGMVGTLTVQ